MKVILLVLLFCISSVIAQATTFQFQATGNISDDRVKQNGWEYRRINVRENKQGYQYNSVTVVSNAAAKDRYQVAGGVRGYTAMPLSTYLLIVDQSSDDYNFSGDASGTIAYAAATVASINEVDMNGNVVTNIPLKSWAKVGGLRNSGDLNYITFQASTSSSIVINATYFLSPRFGRVNYGNAVVTPRSMESVFSISNYTFASATNSLQMIMYAVSGTGSVTNGTGIFRGSTFSSTDSNGNSIYIAAASQCFLGGSSAATNITVAVSSVDTSLYLALDPTTFGEAKTRYVSATTISTQQFTINFPAGAGTNSNSIMYDPTVGTGASPADSSTANTGSSTSSSSASFLTYSVYGIVIAVLLAFF